MKAISPLPHALPISLPRNQNEARRVAAKAYPLRCCVLCGLQIETCLVVAHLNHNPGDKDRDNLAWLCWTHHWMFDCGFYPIIGLKMLRDDWQRPGGHLPSHGPRMKGAGAKAALARKRSAAADKAWATRLARVTIPK